MRINDWSSDVCCSDRRFNRVELRGAAFGDLRWTGPDGTTRTLDKRPKGVVRSVTDTDTLTGGTLHFTNEQQEEPIQEIWAYDVAPGAVPNDNFSQIGRASCRERVCQYV